MIRLLARLFTLRLVVRAVRDKEYEPNALAAHRAVQTDVTRRMARGPGRAGTQMPGTQKPGTQKPGTPVSSTVSQGSEEGIPPQRSGGPGPDTPLDLDKGDWKVTARRALKEIKEDRVTLVAAGMAYYFFLAIFPAFIALIGIYGLLDIEPSGLLEAISRNLPAGAGKALTSGLQRANSTSDDASLIATIAGIAVALWSASSGMVALQKGLNVAYDVDTDRKFVGARLVALALIVATLLLGGVPSPFFTFDDSNVILTVLEWAITVVAVIVLFSLYYRLGPNRGGPTWQWVTPGGFVGALIWILGSLAFFVYAGQGSYSKTYGPLAGVVVLIFWLFITSLSVLVGGELNAELERQSSKKAA